MTRPKLYKEEPKYVRDCLWKAVELGEHVHKAEENLIQHLQEIDVKRLYLRFGYRTMLGFCNFGLKFTKPQYLRLVNRIRRIEFSASDLEELSAKCADVSPRLEVVDDVSEVESFDEWQKIKD